MGSNHIRYYGDEAVLRLTTDASLNYVLHETELSLDWPLTLIVGADESITDNVDQLSRSFLSETEIYWQGWVRDLNIPFDWQVAVIRAAITPVCSFSTPASSPSRHSSGGEAAHSATGITGSRGCATPSSR